MIFCCCYSFGCDFHGSAISLSKVKSIFQLVNKNLPNSSCHFRKYKSVCLQILHQSSVQSNITLLYFFLAQTLYTLVKSNSLKLKFLRFLSAQVKIHQIPHINFELTSRILFKFCIIFPSHDGELLCKFQVHTFPTLDKRTQ